jgi:formate-dependent nitrite reductase membrane component NrfD
MVIGLKEEGGWVIVCFCFRGLLVRTSFLVELAEHFSDDLPHALQRLEVILGLVELLLGVLHLIAELTNPRVELLFVWCGSRWSVGRSVGGGDFSDLFPTRVP